MQQNISLRRRKKILFVSWVHMSYEHFDEMQLHKSFVSMAALRWDDQWSSACREWKSLWTYEDPAEVD